MPDSEHVDNLPPALSLRMRLVVKRCIDIVLSVVLLLVLSPILVLSALAILLRDGRPVLFRQIRIGRDGRPFVMVKFRTMAKDAETMLDDLRQDNDRTGPLFKSNNDPRVTTIGRVLRRSSIDELPQLFNVLTGRMSLVGPRPALPSEVAEFSAELRRRESVPQGLTGLWQVDGRTDPDFSKYAELDLHYVENWTLRLDAWIIVRTPFVILGHLIHRDAVNRAPASVEKPVDASTGPSSSPPIAAPVASMLPVMESRTTGPVRRDSALELAE